MVLASNEWLNDCEDDQRSTTTTTTATENTPLQTAGAGAASTTATATTHNRAAAAAGENHTAETAPLATATTTITATETAAATTTITTERAVSAQQNEIMSENSNSGELQAQQQQQQHIQKSTLGDVVLSVTVNAPANELNGPNAPVEAEIVNNNSDALLHCDKSNANATIIKATPPTNSNNKAAEEEGSFSLDTTSGLVEESGGNSNTNASNNANPYFASNPNSNTNTLQAAIVRPTIGAAGGPPPPPALSNSITPQALTNALQTVMMNANAAASSGSGNTPNSNTITITSVSNAGGTMGANLQNSFLSTLGIELTGSGKELNSTFGGVGGNVGGAMVDAQTINLLNNIAAAAAAASTTNTPNPNSNLNTGHTMNYPPYPPPSVAVGNHTSSININLDTGDSNNSSGSGQAKIILICEANSHPFQTRTIHLTPNIECKVGRLIAKSKASESNAIFDCKVLSRNHAVLWYTDDGKFWVKDTKSSNGTFINENKLGTEAAELHFGDIVKFGVDVVENSRKEVHGCIIAFVKLYLPDGREAISIDSNSATQRSPYSGEGRISYEEMHRLNLYMQEVSQREKALKSKLFNIQNVLDATRKNSALCWQSLIAEDQLLHRINSLEKKLQIMEKNVPESVLRNEVLKLLEDKNSYQLTAKEALRKVYQERCDALQLLSKMELAYANADGECKILRDQIMSTKQSLQDVNSRLQRLESDYNEYKDEAERKQQECKEQEEQRIAEMTEKLQQREQECEELRRRISEVMLKCAEQVDEEEKKLQLQAIEKLDAVIGDMDLGEDEEEDEDDNDGEGDADEDDNDDDDDDDVIDVIAKHAAAAVADAADGGAKHKEDGNEKSVAGGSGKKSTRQKRATKSLDALNGSGKSLNSSDEIEKILNTSADYPKAAASKYKRIKGKAGSPKESTILKWLQNSDLNKKEGSMDIFKAICNESDSSDEQEPPIYIPNESVSGIDANTSTTAEDIKLKYKKSKNKLQNVQTILSQLVEAEMSKECYKTKKGAMERGEENEYVEAAEKKEEDYDKDDADGKEKLILLQRSLTMLSEAYKEICESVQGHQQQGETMSCAQTHILKYEAATNTNNSKKLPQHDMLKPLIEEEETAEDDNEKLATSHDSIDNEECSTASAVSTTATTPSTIVAPPPPPNDVDADKLREEIRACQEKILELNLKCEQVENDAQNTLEIMQIECDGYREKVAQMSKVAQQACEEKEQLQQRLHEERAKLEKMSVVTAAAAVTTLGDGQSDVDAAASAGAAKKVVSTPTQQQSDLDVAATESNEEVHKSASTTPRQAAATESTPHAIISSSSGVTQPLLVDEDMEAEWREDFALLNSDAARREEELIVYKECLEKMQDDNLKLRREIAELLVKNGGNAHAHAQTIRQMLTYGTAAAAAILLYFMSTYF